MHDSDPQPPLVLAQHAGREPAPALTDATARLARRPPERRSFRILARERSTPMRIFSGIQATGDKHLGNYSGGFRQYAETQDRGEAFFCIVDLHSITVEYDAEALRRSTMHVTAMLFATGLDPERSTVFAQSHVTAHPEAAWLLSAVTSFGQLGRMTQFKEKGERQEFVSAGLFTYPVLMAGDILLYQTDLVPIGDDQRQHLELTRDLAERFNARFGETFRLPEGQFPELGARIMDLQEPQRKMSTTAGTPQGTVLLADPPDVVRRKIKSAVTDSGREVVHDREAKPGIANLIEILSVATGDSIGDIEARYDGQGYGPFKADVAEAVVELLDPIRLRYEELRADEGELRRLLAVGAEKAREESAPTLEAMYERMGFVRL
jgi:tryptophanyl-tRNA synthetase